MMRRFLLSYLSLTLVFGDLQQIWASSTVANDSSSNENSTTKPWWWPSTISTLLISSQLASDEIPILVDPGVYIKKLNKKFYNGNVPLIIELKYKYPNLHEIWSLSSEVAPKGTAHRALLQNFAEFRTTLYNRIKRTRNAMKFSTDLTCHNFTFGHVTEDEQMSYGDNKVVENDDDVDEERRLNLEINRANAIVKNRGKRGLAFIGEIANWCCDILDKSYMEPFNQNQIETMKYLIKLKDDLSTEDKNMVKINKGFESLQNGMNVRVAGLEKSIKELATILKDQEKLNDFQNLSSNINRELARLITLTQLVNMDQENQLVYDIITACLSGRLSLKSISPAALENELIQIKEVLSKKNLKLVYDITDLSYYYTKQIVKCTYTPESILINIQVPFQKNKDFELFETVVYPFDYGNEDCVLKHKPGHLIRSGNKVIRMEDLYRQCKMNEDLCHIYDYEYNHVTDEECGKSLLQPTLSVNLIKEKCNLDCIKKKNHKVKVQQLDINVFTISNFVQGMRVNSSNGMSKLITVPKLRLGSIRIILACGDKLIIPSFFVVEPDQPCPSFLTKFTN
jgi:hypothetical protein